MEEAVCALCCGNSDSLKFANAIIKYICIIAEQFNKITGTVGLSYANQRQVWTHISTFLKISASMHLRSKFVCDLSKEDAQMVSEQG